MCLLHVGRRQTCIEDSLGQDGTELGHNVIVLVVYHLCIKLPELVDLKQLTDGKHVNTQLNDAGVAL